MGASDRWASGSIFFAAPGEAAGRAGRGWGCRDAGASEPGQAGSRAARACRVVGVERGAPAAAGVQPAGPPDYLTGLLGRPFSVSPRHGFLSYRRPPGWRGAQISSCQPPRWVYQQWLIFKSCSSPAIALRTAKELPLQRTEVLVFHQLLKQSMISLWWATCFPRVFHLELYLGTQRHRVEGSIVSQASQSESYE